MDRKGASYKPETTAIVPSQNEVSLEPHGKGFEFHNRRGKSVFTIKYHDGSPHGIDSFWGIELDYRELEENEFCIYIQTPGQAEVELHTQRTAALPVTEGTIIYLQKSSSGSRELFERWRVHITPETSTLSLESVPRENNA